MRGKSFFQLVHILFGFREEAQDIVNRHIRFLTSQLDQAGNRRMSFFFFDVPRKLLAVHHQSFFLHRIHRNLSSSALVNPVGSIARTRNQ